MGYRELTEELQREAEVKIEDFRRRAADELSRVREQARSVLEKKREERVVKLAAAVEEETRGILSEARRKVLEMRLDCMRELSGRLYGLARSILPMLKEQGGEELFLSLSGELPGFHWETVKVSPADLETARRHFGSAEIRGESGICGGMEVCAENGRICVVNTLDKRLARGWPELLPRLIAAVYREIGRDAFAKD